VTHEPGRDGYADHRRSVKSKEQSRQGARFVSRRDAMRPQRRSGGKLASAALFLASTQHVHHRIDLAGERARSQSEPKRGCLVLDGTECDPRFHSGWQ